MDKKTLMEAFGKIAAQTGFVPDKKAKPYMPLLQKGQYRSVIAQGKYGKKAFAAILKVSPYENYQIVADDFRNYRRALENITYNTNLVVAPEIYRLPITPVLLPEVLKSGEKGKFSFVIQSTIPRGERLLPSYPKSSPAQRNLVAKLYWDTRRVLGIPWWDIPNIGPEDYFMRRYCQFTGASAAAKTDETFITKTLENKAFSFIFKHANDMGEMWHSFSHFTNTDIIKCGEAYYIIDATIEARPQMYEAAFWLWGMTMYAYDIPPKKWIKELEKWISAFLRGCPSYTENPTLTLSVCLVERMLGTLLVDLPLRRSPFDKLGDEAIAKEAKLAQSVIRYLCASFPSE